MKINKIKTEALEKLEAEVGQTQKDSAYFQHITEELERRASK
jgi:translation elongation factor EF-1alpha